MIIIDRLQLKDKGCPRVLCLLRLLEASDSGHWKIFLARIWKFAALNPLTSDIDSLAENNYQKKKSSIYHSGKVLEKNWINIRSGVTKHYRTFTKQKQNIQHKTTITKSEDRSTSVQSLEKTNRALQWPVYLINSHTGISRLQAS